jgi:hypothetical protein
MYFDLDLKLKDVLPHGSCPFKWFLGHQGTKHREEKPPLTYEARLGNLHSCVKRYLGYDWEAPFLQRQKFWQKIVRQAVRLYEGFHGKRPTLPKTLNFVLIDG